MTAIPDNRKVRKEQTKGLVRSVTGTTIDNTDPLNPVDEGGDGSGGLTAEFFNFVPTLTDSGGGATYVISSPTGQVYRIQRMVYVYIIIAVDSTIGTPTGELRIGEIAGNFSIQGIPSGEVRIFTGSNQTDDQISLLYPNNVDAVPVRSITLRRKPTGSSAIGISFTNGTIEIAYSYLMVAQPLIP